MYENAARADVPSTIVVEDRTLKDVGVKKKPEQAIQNKLEEQHRRRRPRTSPP